MCAVRLAASFLTLLLVTSAYSWGEPQGREILVLAPTEPTRPAMGAFVAGLQSSLDQELRANILDTEQVMGWGAPGDQRARIWFDEKYRDRQIDAIVAIGAANLDLALHLRAERWPQAAVFYLLWGDPRSFRSPSGTSGVFADYLPFRSVETALRLFPSTQHLVAVGGWSAQDRAMNEPILAQMRVRFPALKVIDLTRLPVREMIARAAHLPPDSAIIVLQTISDVEGRPINNPQLVRSLATSSGVPIFDNLDLSFGAGSVGGPLLSWKKGGIALGQQITKVFDGLDANSLAPVVIEPETRFDARQLQRWRIPESRLPPGAAVEFRTPTLWGQHRKLILATLLVVALQAVMIALLLLQRKRLLLSKLARSRSEQALHSQEALNQAVLRSLSGYVSILDRTGKILQVNEPWRGAGVGVAEGFFARTSVGDDYIACWELCFPQAGDSSGLLGRRVREVLAGETTQAALEWRISGHDLEARWLEIRCDVLQWPEGGAVLSHVDITERKRAEIQAERNLQALSQSNRVAALGELAGALAHELNQPLAAILINAETLEQLLANESTPNSESRDIVREIISDDERAGQIIRKMRSLLQDRESNGVPLNMTEIAASVVKLLANEAMLRKVAVRCELTDGLPSIIGDTVQLQQVVLNLMLNAMDAVKDMASGERTVTVSTFLDPSEAVVVEVRDTGPGISAKHLPRLFDHFFTTKREGLGLGLSISRSIVESLHGKIEAENCSTGACFRVCMPVVQVSVPEELPV